MWCIKERVIGGEMSLYRCDANTVAVDRKTKEVTYKDLAKYSYLKEDTKTSFFDFPKVSWFTKLMNKYGWYRETTVYVIDSSNFMFLRGYKKELLDKIKGEI